MRISDWSSDVCSSDLDPRRYHGRAGGVAEHRRDATRLDLGARRLSGARLVRRLAAPRTGRLARPCRAGTPWQAVRRARYRAEGGADLSVEAGISPGRP